MGASCSDPAKSLADPAEFLIRPVIPTLMQGYTLGITWTLNTQNKKQVLRLNQLTFYQDIGHFGGQEQSPEHLYIVEGCFKVDGSVGVKLLSHQNKRLSFRGELADNGIAGTWHNFASRCFDFTIVFHTLVYKQDNNVLSIKSENEIVGLVCIAGKWGVIHPITSANTNFAIEYPEGGNGRLEATCTDTYIAGQYSDEVGTKQYHFIRQDSNTPLPSSTTEEASP